MNKIIIIDKEKNMTSRDVVNKVSKILGTKKIGHTGTLDPLATGVLVLCVGKATKLVDLITCYDKEYIAKVCLGTLTDTLDITGNIIKEKETNITKEEIENTLKSFIPGYEQEVPIYSAVKINGKKLYEYARNGETVELPKRYIKINSIDLISDIEYENGKTYFSFITNVSKGTYIRSLINDIGKKLNTYGTMVELRRTKQGIFNIEDAYTLEDIENNNYKILDAKEVLKLPKVIVDKNLEFKVKNGQVLTKFFEEDKAMIINQNNELLAIYQKKDDTYVKPYKML